MTKKEQQEVEIVVSKHAGGRPSDYDPSFCAIVIECGEKGYSRAQIAAYIGICRKTLHNWEQEYPEFLHATTQAKDLALAWWEHAGQKGMFMTGFSANAFGLQMRNRFPEDYRDFKSVAHTGPDGEPLKVVFETVYEDED